MLQDSAFTYSKATVRYFSHLHEDSPVKSSKEYVQKCKGKIIFWWFFQSIWFHTRRKYRVNTTRVLSLQSKRYCSNGALKKQWLELPWPRNLANTARDIRNYWTTVSTLIGHINSVYHDLFLLNAETKLYHWAIGSLCIWTTPNWLIMVNAPLIDLMCQVNYICTLTEDTVTCKR